MSNGGIRGTTVSHRKHAAAEVVAALRRAVLDAVGTVVVGKRDALELVLAGILAGGHVLWRTCPGWVRR